ncbi:MAG TPA: glucose 1-dehydrogenase [Acidimicrobiales bacterium]|nr:glucose 1-dehydrogenase [Acidimicrobiales bacterium]
MGGRLEGKVALISGGARGQGASEADLFVQEGARVVIGDVLDDEGKATAERIGDGCKYVHLDVTLEDDWQAALATTIDEFGAPDILVNNAGIFIIRPIIMTTLEDFERVVKINQTGVFLGIKTVGPSMCEQQRGSIINISSVAGLKGTAGTIAYSASKWAVRGMTKCAANEYAPFGVRVNSVHPGIIDTPMAQEFKDLGVMDMVRQNIPMGKETGPETVAKLVLYLASDDSFYSTGSEFVVDGGMVTR